MLCVSLDGKLVLKKNYPYIKLFFLDSSHAVVNLCMYVPWRKTWKTFPLFPKSARKYKESGGCIWKGNIYSFWSLTRHRVASGRKSFLYSHTLHGRIRVLSYLCWEILFIFIFVIQFQSSKSFYSPCLSFLFFTSVCHMWKFFYEFIRDKNESSAW